MASATSVMALLAMRRSTQSGTKAMTGAYVAVYSDVSDSTLAYLFGGGRMDLSTMEANDHIDIRVRKRLIPGGDWVVDSEMPFDNVQPDGFQIAAVGPIPDVYGVEIAMRQTTGTLRSIQTEFYAAKIIGTT